jgi:hypothetical protein
MGTIIRHLATPSHTPGLYGDSIRPWIVVDGQQRLTALMLLLAAVRDAVRTDRQLNGKDVFATLTKARLDSEEGTSVTLVHLTKLSNNHYLEFTFGTERTERIGKLLPTELNNDRDVYENVVFRRSADQRKRHFRHYQILKDECIGSKLDGFKTASGGPDYASQINWIHDCLDALKRIQVIYITVDEKVDDVQQIFESINHKGEQLSFTDLIRNHVMSVDGMSPNERKKVYKEFWTPIERALCPLFGEKDGRIIRRSLLEGFFAAYVTMLKGQPVGGKQLFDEFSVLFKKSRSAVALGGPHPLEELKSYALTYQWLNDTAKGDQRDDIRGIVQRFSELKFTTPMPLLLKFVGKNPDTYPTAKQLDDALGVLESYFVRRALLGKTVKGMSEYFAVLACQFDAEAPNRENFAHWLNNKLINVSSKNKDFKELYFVDDIEFLEEVTKERAYAHSRNVTSFALVAVEKKRSRKEVAGDISEFDIEHVLPQEYDDYWLEDLKSWHPELSDGKIADEVDLVADTIGNLTLTDYNRELQNFNLKRKQYHKKANGNEVGYKCSNIKICKDDFGTISKWTFEDIRQRSAKIGAEIVKCFPYQVP